MSESDDEYARKEAAAKAMEQIRIDREQEARTWSAASSLAAALHQADVEAMTARDAKVIGEDIQDQRVPERYQARVDRARKPMKERSWVAPIALDEAGARLASRIAADATRDIHEMHVQIDAKIEARFRAVVAEAVDPVLRAVQHLAVTVPAMAVSAAQVIPTADVADFEASMRTVVDPLAKSVSRLATALATLAIKQENIVQAVQALEKRIPARSMDDDRKEAAAVKAELDEFAGAMRGKGLLCACGDVLLPRQEEGCNRPSVMTEGRRHSYIRCQPENAPAELDRIAAAAELRQVSAELREQVERTAQIQTPKVAGGLLDNVTSHLDRLEHMLRVATDRISKLEDSPLAVAPALEASSQRQSDLARRVEALERPSGIPFYAELLEERVEKLETDRASAWSKEWDQLNARILDTETRLAAVTSRMVVLDQAGERRDMLDDQVKGRLTSLERLRAEHDERIAINDREMHLQVDRLDRHNEERGKEVNRFISDLQARYADQRSEISDLRAAANEAVKVDTSHHQRIKLAEAKLAEWEPMISTVEFATTRVLGNLREEGELRNKEDVRLHQRIDAAEATIREEGELRMKADVTLSAAIANLAKEFERHRKAPDDHGIAILETTPPGFITPAAQAPLVLSDQELIDLAHLARVAKPGVTLGLEFVAAQRIDALWVRLEREQERRALRNVPR